MRPRFLARLGHAAGTLVWVRREGLERQSAPTQQMHAASKQEQEQSDGNFKNLDFRSFRDFVPDLWRASVGPSRNSNQLESMLQSRTIADSSC